MKVYQSSYPGKRDFIKVPQIRITNSKLKRAGFKIGVEYKVIYLNNKIILKKVLSNQN